MIVMSEHPVIFFDGVCNLCNGYVQFVIRRDPSRRFRFAPLQSDTGQKMLADTNQATEKGESIVLWDNRQIYRKSSAVLRIAKGLKFPWPLLSLFLIVPRFIRDLVYDWVARHRYQWFGRREACMIPTPELQSLFLE